MKKSWIVIGIVVVVLFILYRMFAGSYNNMVNKDEQVSSQWAQVENVYQRRADLIPNLVRTVQGVANFEKSTLTAVIEARASATQIKVDPKNLTEESLQKFQASQGQLSQALGRLMVVSEQYPQLKANQNFSELQAQLEGTENRIAVERGRFNEMAQEFNTYIRQFPQSMLAGMYGFSKKAYFQADQGANKAPEVKF
jgi:LemA protein